jgi:hypothetical protein
MFTVVTARKALQDLLAEKRVSWKDDDHFKQLTAAAGITSVDKETIAAGMVAVDEDGEVIVEDIGGRSFRLGWENFPLLDIANSTARTLRLAEDRLSSGSRKALRSAAVLIEDAARNLERGIDDHRLAARRDLRETLLASLDPMTWGDVEQTRKVLALLLECLPGDEADPGDGAIRAAFDRWLAQVRLSEAPGSGGLPDNDVPADIVDALNDAIVEIASTPASGLVGFAIKAYLAVFDGADFPQRAGGALGALGALDERYYGAGDMHLSARLFRGLVTDAARFMPDLAPLATLVINSPTVLPSDDGGRS